MKRITSVIVFAMILGVFATQSFANPEKDNPIKPNAPKWELFSENLVTILQSDHEALKLSALQHIVRYGDQVDVDDAVFDIVRIYRNHSDQDVRHMAAIALGRMDNAWAMDMLRRSERFEKADNIRQTIRVILAEHDAMHP